MRSVEWAGPNLLIHLQTVLHKGPPSGWSVLCALPDFYHSGHTSYSILSISYTRHLILRIHLNRAHSAPANSASGSGRFYNPRWVKLVGRVLVARDPSSGVWRRVLCPAAPVYVTPAQVIIVSACYVHFVPPISAEKGEMGKKGRR